MSHTLRTVFAFVLFGVGGGVLSWLVLPWVWLVGRLFGRETAIRSCQRALQGGFRWFLRLLSAMRLFEPQWRLSEGIRIDEPRVIICNHPCLLDTVTMVARYDHVICLMKQSFYDNPLFFGLAKLCGYVPAGREGSVRGHERMLEEAQDRIRRGYTVLTFPECRRTPLPGHGRLPFRRGPAEIAAQAGIPVIPVRITCTPRVLAREEPIYRMPTECARYTAQQLPERSIAPGRTATLAATQDIQNLLQPPEAGSDVEPARVL